MFIFFAKHGGQSCNRLWALFPAYTFAREHHSRLIVLFSDSKYLDLFPNARKDRYIKFWFTKKFWHKVRFIDFVVGFLERREIIGELRNAGLKRFRISSIHGWAHHGDFSFYDNQAYKKTFIKTFSFSDQVVRRVDGVMKGFDGKTIGVHVRRGDYREWKNGRYYYSDETWRRILLSIQNQFAGTGEKCRFLICSNEPFEMKEDNLSIFQIPGADGITDLCALSKCDLIVGPPSTYSQWSSFVGNVPLSFVLNSDAELRLSDFSPIVRQDVFENGRCISCGIDGQFVYN